MFVEALRRHLELARRGLLTLRRFPTWLDPERREAWFLAIFEAEEASLAGREARWFEDALRPWDGEFKELLVECLLTGLADAALFVGEPDKDELLLERAVLSVLLRHQIVKRWDALSGGIRGRRSAEVAQEADARARAEHTDLRGVGVSRYADELQLARTVRGEVKLLAAGEVFLGLRGREAVRWLLALEVSSALGDHDRWRVSMSRAKALTESLVEFFEDGAPAPWPWDFFTRRLELEGLVEVEERRDEHGVFDWRCRVTPLGVELFGELDQPSGEALRSLARATLADEAHEALHGRPPAVSEAAELGRHTRMVAHELRNILVPVQLSLKQLRRLGGSEGFVADNAETLSVISGGLERALRFATETARMTSHGSSRDELFAVEAALRDAIAGVQSALRHPVEFEAAAGVERVYLRGRRDRFVLAVLNLLRNASQVGGAEVRILVQAEMLGRSGARLVVLVEDDGPGVPADQRAAIFADGVSFRAGGSGHGLALVREVIEVELRGSIHCEPSPRGGARFVLRLPIPLEGVT
ncbi:sensor histidine kinase [Nannocystis bainbridge]|uniref:histidine kinase n=1 Tax=Nannocystis bainbridge TaxID=2995303 RepID=A0ABT5ECS7_9BACT|nr:sensor histidine kinase [Nannocystis bainbridge]MDC0723238.1 sensor histidine kinase [Nannocystis bainbridge]